MKTNFKPSWYRSWVCFSTACFNNAKWSLKFEPLPRRQGRHTPQCTLHTPAKALETLPQRQRMNHSREGNEWTTPAKAHSRVVWVSAGFSESGEYCRFSWVSSECRVVRWVLPDYSFQLPTRRHSRVPASTARVVLHYSPPLFDRSVLILLSERFSIKDLNSLNFSNTSLFAFKKYIHVFLE